MKPTKLTSLHWLLLAAAALGLAACASIQRPQGGPRDEKPPVFVSSNPPQGAVRHSRQRIDLYFDENVQLDDAFNKVIVSPVQKNNAQVSANGKRVTVELKDTLQPNTTYSIDFGDAIKDLNEGNILDGFNFAFSTGDSIDTLRIAGMVLQARTLEPAQGMLVGIHSNLSDTAITSLPFDRIARTNQYGQFTIQNVKPGRYRIYALNDLNRDFRWDRSEDVAFLDSIIVPYSLPIEVVDTLRSAENKDSLATRMGTAYYPNDVLLTWFNEDYKAQYIKDYSRPERRRIEINMSAPADTLPDIAIARGPLEGLKADSWALLQKNATLDTLQYWITDTAVLATDSLYLSVRHLRTDTAEALVWKPDTLKFFFKDPKAKKKKKDEEADTLPPKPVFVGISTNLGAALDVYKPIMLKADQPIDSIAQGGWRLEHKVDTLWEAVPGITLEVDSLDPLAGRLARHAWAPGDTYRFTIDSAAVAGIYGQHNNKLSNEFKVKSLDEYANLVFNIAGLPDSAQAVVELLGKNDEPTATAAAQGGRATFKHLAPGATYARLYIDANANGKWDTGSLLDSVQPEEVYYYPKKLNLRKNWDVTQTWDILDTPVDEQKHWDIKKNKPKLKKGEKAPVQDEEEDDEFGSGAFGQGAAGYGRSGRNGMNGRNGMGGMNGMGSMGGFGRR